MYYPYFNTFEHILWILVIICVCSGVTYQQSLHYQPVPISPVVCFEGTTLPSLDFDYLSFFVILDNNRKEAERWAEHITYEMRLLCVAVCVSSTKSGQCLRSVLSVVQEDFTFPDMMPFDYRSWYTFTTETNRY